MNPTFKQERLRHYADYLMKGDIKCERFYSAKISNSIALEKGKNKSLQPLFFLPIMELPQIFHRDWYYDANYMPIYRDNKEKETISSVINYFGINKSIFLHLFSKGRQRPEIWGGTELSAKPTIPELVNNIEELINRLHYYSEINGNDFLIYLN